MHLPPKKSPVDKKDHAEFDVVLVFSGDLATVTPKAKKFAEAALQSQVAKATGVDPARVVVTLSAGSIVATIQILEESAVKIMPKRPEEWEVGVEQTLNLDCGAIDTLFLLDGEPSTFLNEEERER